MTVDLNDNNAPGAAGESEIPANQNTPPTPAESKPADAPAPPSGSSSSYEYWRGANWVKEYDQRKLVQPYYHAQEIMLADYFLHHAPARVLEFGCGVGRHLSYLSKIPGLDIHGFDQSPTMLAGIERWASKEWRAEHIKLGEPVAPLPYPDQYFDIVFTAEVLVHVAPADLEFVLSELLRVARWQVLHIERSFNVYVVDDEHCGCWNHDLIASYKSLGRDCELLPEGYSVHSPYRVALDPSHTQYAWSPVLLSLLRRMEHDLLVGIDRQRERIGALAYSLDEKTREADSLTQKLADAEDFAKRLRVNRAELKQQLQLSQARQLDLQADKKDLEQLVQKILAMQATLERRVAEGNAIRAGLEEQVQNQRAEEATLVERLQALQARIADLENQLQVTIAQRNDYSQQMQESIELRRQKDELERMVEEMTLKLKGITAQRRAGVQSIHDMRDRQMVQQNTAMGTLLTKILGELNRS